MFGTQTNIFVIAVVALACVTTTVFADPTIFVGTFEERRSSLNNSFLTGTVFYYYDPSNPEDSRLRFRYEGLVGGNAQITTVSNLYHFGDKAMYSMCPSSCTGKRNKEYPDPWYVNSDRNDEFYTKTGETEAGCTWYTRKNAIPSAYQNKFNSPQVSRILTKKGNWNDVKKIEFVDGRKITILSTLPTSDYNKNSPVFTFDEGVTCQSAACNVYADVVFVVDNSKSVNSDEWKQTMRFVLNVLDEFDYGDSGVEAAVIQFSGTGITGEFEAGYKLKTAVSPCRPNNPGVESYEKAHQACGRFTSDPEQYDENHYPFPFNGRDDSASFISPSGAQTLSGSKESIIQPLVKSYQPEAYYRTPDNSNMWSSFGSTCQSFGLELAMRAFDNSERKNLEGLNRIVIVVTDGQDKCPNRTRKATDLLKKRRDQGGYGAYVFEIGVSLVSGCCNEYDSAFLMEIASDIGGEPAYYAVDDYDGMTTATSRLTRPICEQFDSTGCPDCTGGFCGCGQCFCPTCEPHQSTCKKYMCVPPEGGQSSLGCQEHNVTCEKTDDGEEADEICTFFQCNGDLEDGHGRCTLVKNDCAELKETFPDDDSQCYKVKCDPLYDGGCYPDPDHDWCQKKHAPKGANDKCEKWVCNKDADGALDDFCYKSFDKAEDEQEKLGKRGKCITITCDHDSGDTKENVNCGSPEIPCNEMECLEVEAVANGGDSKDYSCVETGTPEADQCGDYVCRKQGGKYKWVRDQTTVPDCVGLAVQAWKEEHQGEWTTEAEALDHGTRCRIIGCEGSCYNREEENCNPECTADDVNGCKAEGFGEGGTTENCVAKTCNAEQNGQGLWETLYLCE